MHKIRVALLTLAAFCSIPAYADFASGVKTRKVSLAGLDLASAEGVAMGYGRLLNAAESVCDRYSGVDLSRRPLLRACMAHAMQRAIADVRAPALTAYYNEKLHPADKALSVASNQ